MTWLFDYAGIVHFDMNANSYFNNFVGEEFAI